MPSGGTVEKNHLAEIELLKIALSEKQAENHHILNRKDELEESLLAWQEKFQRLHESHKRIQGVNQNLEEKLLRLVDENSRQRTKLTNNCASLNIRLNKSNARIAHLQNEIDRYKKDISLAINLLRLNPDSFISPNFNSLPLDTQSKLCQFIKKSSDDAEHSAKFRGYQSVPVNDPIYHHNDMLSPVTVSKFLESELKRNVGIQTTSVNLFGGTLKDISHDDDDDNFIHHEKCDRVKMNAHMSGGGDCHDNSSGNKLMSPVAGARVKEAPPVEPPPTTTTTKKISVEQFKEKDIKHFLSFVKNKSHKSPRICAVRISDDGIFLDLDSSQELFIKTSASSPTDDSDELGEKVAHATLHDETYSVNKTDSEKFNEIKSSSTVQVETPPCSSENALLKHQRVAEWLKSNHNTSIQQVNDKPKDKCKINSSQNDDLLQMEYNVKQFMLKQQNEWKDEIINDEFCHQSISKLHRTETNL